MKPLHLIACLLPLWAACHSLPPAPQLVPTPLETPTDEAAPFLKTPWRLVHRIESRWPGGAKAYMLGVVTLKPSSGQTACAVLTLEGLLLFQAVHDGRQLQVTRALAPFDQPALAERMIADIRLVFVAPPAPPVAMGRDSAGRFTRRYTGPEGLVDVAREPAPDAFEIRRYDADGRLIRRVRLTTCRPPGASGDTQVPCRITLEGLGAAAYHLEMDLVEAAPLP
jgi:hypothetical protein